MYEVDKNDKIVALENVPQSCVGSPEPIVLSTESRAVIAFYLQNTPEDWDGNSVRVVSYKTEWPLAIVEFAVCYALMFGAPNDESFQRHPLADRGLHPYGAFEVKNSSWIRQLERMNSIHPYHKPERFWTKRHFIFAFHDSTFECVADGLQVEEIFGSIESVLPSMSEKLWARVSNKL